LFIPDLFVIDKEMHSTSMFWHTKTTIENALYIENI